MRKSVGLAVGVLILVGLVGVPVVRVLRRRNVNKVVGPGRKSASSIEFQASIQDQLHQILDLQNTEADKLSEQGVEPSEPQASSEEIFVALESETIGNEELVPHPINEDSSTGDSKALEVAGMLNALSAAYLEERKHLEARLLSKAVWPFNARFLGLEHMETEKSRSIHIDAKQNCNRLSERGGKPQVEFSRLACDLSHLAIRFLDPDDWTIFDAVVQLDLDLRKELFGPKHSNYIDRLLGVGSLYRKNGNYESAESQVKLALELRARSHGRSHGSVARVLDELMRIYVMQRRFDEAEAAGTRALIIRQKAGDQGGLAKTSHIMGLLFCAQAKYRPGVNALQEALKLREATVGSDHATVAEILETYAGVLRVQGRIREAEEAEKRIAQIRAKQAEKALASSASY